MLKSTLLAFLTAVNIRDAMAVANGDNKDIFPPCCALLQLADGDPIVQPALEELPEPPTALYHLNMTLADKTWRQYFIEKSAAEAIKPKQEKPSSLPQEWQTMWSHWAAEAVFVENKDAGGQTGGEAILKAYGLNGLTRTQLRNARKRIAALADSAFEIYQISKKTGTKTPKADRDIVAELRKALYDSNEPSKSEENLDRLFGSTGGTYTEMCAGAGNHAGTTIAATIMCICGLKSDKSAAAPCYAGGTTDIVWGARNSPAGTTWTTIRGICPKISKPVISEAALRNLIHSTQAKIHAKANDLYFGPIGETNCNGSDGGSCVKFTGLATGGTADYTKVKWMRTLNDIADNINSRTTYNQQTKKTKDSLNQLIREAETVARREKLDPELQAMPAAAEQQKTPEKPTAEDCNAHKTNTTCLSPCTWHESESDKDKKCKLDPVKVEQQVAQKAGAEEGTAGRAAASTGCATNGTKAE
uniref:Variant surface glycoprotein 1125.1134 n=1 Tax=Trypanosoma brucei TaxID=5691 RepID=A0A1J0R6B1_9TRYP|nr:variant surface glycoprotein 1125.1134 [Trypanosoma brucei]